jgi:hypothetical protein
MQYHKILTVWGKFYYLFQYAKLYIFSAWNTNVEMTSAILGTQLCHMTVQYNEQKKGRNDKHWTTKHYTENWRLSNKPNKNGG